MPDRRLLRSLAGWLAAALAYVAATLLFTWPLALDMPSKSAYFDGDACLNAYILAWGRHALLADPLNAFNAGFFHPFPGSIALSENLFGVSAFLIPLFPVKNPILAYNVVFFASFPINGLAWCWVLRRWRLAPLAAWVGGLSFTFLPWRFSQIGHIQTLFTWWLPIGLFAVESWARRGSWRGAILAAVAVGASFYTCVYHAIFLALLGGAFGAAAFLSAPDWRARLRAMAAQLAASGALAALIVLPALPSYLEVRRVLGDVNPIESLARRGACLSDYLRAADFNRLLGGAHRLIPRNPYSDIPWEHDLFLGFVPLALAASLALALRLSPDQIGQAEKRSLKAIAWPLAIGAAWMFVLSLGPELHWMGNATGIPLPYRALHAWLPGMQSIRVPARAALPVGLALSGLAAMALHVWGELAARRARWLAPALSLAAAALTAGECLNTPLLINSNPTYERLLKAQREIANRPRGAVIALPFDDTVTYAAFLSTWPHFYPITNGRSGYLFAGTAEIERSLQSNEWGESQAELLRWLGARYLLIDLEKSSAPPVEALRALPDRLRALGFAVAATQYAAENVLLLEIESPDAKPAPPPKADFDVAHFIAATSGGREIALSLNSRNSPYTVPPDAGWMEATIKAYGKGESALWTRKMRFRMPPFLVRAQLTNLRIPLSRRDADGVRRVTIRLELPSLLYKRKIDVALD